MSIDPSKMPTPVKPISPLTYAGRSPRPSWVRLALWGVPSRRVAFGLMWLCMLIAAAGPAVSVWIRGAWIAAFMVFAGVWYWAAITWVDRCDQWD